MPQQLPLLTEDRPTYSTQSDETDRAAAIERLRAKLSDPTFHAIEGFPIGEDEAILALSDPPHYTACPNPFLPEIVARWQEERRDIRAGLGLPEDAANGYSREPFAADVSEGKNDPTCGNAQFLPHQGAAQGDHAPTVNPVGFCGTARA